VRRLIFLIVLMAFSLSLASGCKQAAKNVWKDTRRYYREYINTPATLKFQEADASAVEDKLATVYTPVGMALESFRRDMLAQDVFPTEAWVNDMFDRYPWLSGVAVVSPEGDMYLQRPAVSMKSLDFMPLFEEDEKISYRDMRAYAQDNPLGPEVYVGTPFFVDNEMKGMVVAHFDPRNLLHLCPQPARLVILSPTFTLWPGHYVMEETPLETVEWEKTLRRRSSDTESNKYGEFLWIAKYIGNLPLVFAASTDEYPIDPRQLEALAAPAPVRDVPTVPAPAPEPAAQEAEEESSEFDIMAAPEARQPAAAQEPKAIRPAMSDTPQPAPLTKDIVWSVQIGAFHNPQYAQDRMNLLRTFGYSPCLMKLYDRNGQLWHVVQIADTPDKEEAFKHVKEFLGKGTGLDYNVGALDAGVVSRRKECF